MTKATMQLALGLDVIRSYKRLSYTPWHALAEFVDNSTQSYFNNRDILDDAFAKEPDGGLKVWITYDRDEGVIRIADNSIGMSYDELSDALHVGLRPEDTSGRSKYGMGMKTAACWLGDYWTIKTKKLGEDVEHEIAIDVEQIANGTPDLSYEAHAGKSPDKHYTIIEITKLHQQLRGRRLGKIKQFLGSMYRQDLRNDVMTLVWQDVPLVWEEVDGKLLVAKDGQRYKKEFEFDVGEKHVYGWVGVLFIGSRDSAGFSIFHNDRVVRGWPDSWRPESLYGQLLGSNDLVNQRLVGEIHLDDFEVSHTKDDILWMGEELDEIEAGLKEHCSDYRQAAKDLRKARDDRGPSDLETAAAVDELKRELESSEMADRISFHTVPPPDAIASSIKEIADSVSQRTETLRATIGESLSIRVWLEQLSPYEPYVVDECPTEDELMVIINTAHPHWSQIRGSEGALNYFRHCIYDAVAEWEARKKLSPLDPNTIKLLKDQLLRVPFEMEMHVEEAV